MTEPETADDDALWRLAMGVRDAGTDALEARIGAGDEALARDLALLREIRDLVRTDRELLRWAEPSARLLASVRAADSRAQHGEVEWLQALPVGMVAGVRGTAPTDAPTENDSVFACVTQEFVLTMSLHREGVPAALRVQGQIARPDGGPYAGVAITYEADHAPVAQAVTDELGEFAFEPQSGADFGLQLELEGRHRFVSLWREVDQF